jgi:hypothetical protein
LVKDKTNTAILGCIIEIICVAFALDTKSFWIVLVIVGFAGVFFIPQVPIILEFGCEIAFPIGEASSSGFLLAGGQLLGFLSVKFVLFRELVSFKYLMASIFGKSS